jgi:hypothetical protein
MGERRANGLARGPKEGASMSRKDYREAARILREAEYLSAEARSRLVASFVTLFADDNPRFSPSKFREACQPERRLSSDFEALRDAGYRAGYAAGSWALDGNSSEDEARSLLRMIDEGDPAWEVPAPLSGEWADGWTAERVFAEITLSAPPTEHDENELLDYWTAGYYQGFEDCAVKDARSMLGLYSPDHRRQS